MTNNSEVITDSIAPAIETMDDVLDLFGEKTIDDEPLIAKVKSKMRF